MMVSVITFNLRFGLANDGENCWDNRKQAVARLLEEHRPDFLAVQEANIFQVEDLAQMLPDYKFIGVRSNAPRFWQDNVIFSASGWEILDGGHFFLSATPEIPSRFAESRWPRQCTTGTYRKNGSRMAVADTHFDFAENVQIKSAKLIEERLSGYECPVVLMGDFNASPSSACYGILTGAFKDAHEPFTDVFDECDSDFNSGTHHGFTGGADCDKGRIDWILQRGFAGVADKSIIRDSCCGRWPSDHFPVKAVLEL